MFKNMVGKPILTLGYQGWTGRKTKIMLHALLSSELTKDFPYLNLFKIVDPLGLLMVITATIIVMDH
jgi:hypothetical protein